MSSQHARQCSITITVDEGDGRTRAVARMDWQGRKLVGVGRTRPYELLPDRAAEKVSITRALSELVARLNASDLDGVSEHPLSACQFARTNDGHRVTFGPDVIDEIAPTVVNRHNPT